MTDNRFFLQQVPQSEYRRSRARKESDTNYLSTELNPLGAATPQLRETLKVFIESQADLIFKTLLPNNEWVPQQRAALLEKIFSQLELT